jgi:hypothetical protein
VGVPLYFFPIQSIHNNPAGIGYLFLAGAIIGSGFGFGFRYYNKIKERKRQEKERIEKDLQYQTELLRKGYADPKEKVWYTFLKGMLDVALQRLGKGYTALVKIHLKEPIESQNTITGLLWHFEPKSPHDIVLRPKYVFHVRYLQQIQDVLTVDSPSTSPYSTSVDPSPLKNSLKKDKVYRSRIIEYYLKKSEKYFSGKEDEMITKIIMHVRSRLSKAKLKSDVKFFEELEMIDFSKHVGDIIIQLGRHYYSEYQGIVFIEGNNIQSCEILGYEPMYAVSITRGSQTTVFPASYGIEKYPLIRDLTVD